MRLRAARGEGSRHCENNHALVLAILSQTILLLGKVRDLGEFDIWEGITGFKTDYYCSHFAAAAGFESIAQDEASGGEGRSRGEGA